MPQIYWSGRSLSTHPYFCCSVQLCMAIVCIFSGGKEGRIIATESPVKLHFCAVLSKLNLQQFWQKLGELFLSLLLLERDSIFFSCNCCVRISSNDFFFLWRWKGGLKFLWVSVDSSSVILYPASGPTDSHCCLQLLQLLSTEAFSSCYARIPDTYPPLFISCHELEWTMFGISPALYESFYKRITLPLGDHVRWFPLSGALSSPV